MYPPRFLVAYGLLALALAASGTASWKLATEHRPRPLAPGAVHLVEQFLGAVQKGDLQTACRLFSAYPACDRTIVAAPLERYDVEPAEPAVGGVDVPAKLNDEFALFSIAGRSGHYRIVDIVADPSSFNPSRLLQTPLAA